VYFPSFNYVTYGRTILYQRARYVLPVSILASMGFQIAAQPDDVTCGPTSLHAVYRYLGYSVELEDVIRSVNYLEEGGTLAAFLGADALRRGFKTRIHSYNLRAFDPSWAGLDSQALIAKLREQLVHKTEPKLRITTEAYIRYLKEGGEITFADLTPDLLRSYFDRGLPVLAGLSATYLYRNRREIPTDSFRTEYDDVRGEPSGHFVVLYGFSERGVLVADPYRDHPFNGGHRYEVDIFRLLNAIMLGVITYDANLLIVSPRTGS
jgi:hypothetical protein